MTLSREEDCRWEGRFIRSHSAALAKQSFVEMKVEIDASRKMLIYRIHLRRFRSCQMLLLAFFSTFNYLALDLMAAAASRATTQKKKKGIKKERVRCLPQPFGDMKRRHPRQTEEDKE